jgi:hypothetical protein
MLYFKMYIFWQVPAWRTLATPNHFSWHSVELTRSSRPHNVRSSCYGSRGRHEFIRLKTAQASLAQHS